MTYKETIVLRNVSTGYSLRHNIRKVITEDINASLRSGELTCLLGPNGAGKSTLLRTMSGFIPALSGEILLSGQAIDHLSPEVLSKEISIVLTDKLSIPDMTLAQLVGLGRSPYTNFWGNLTDQDREIVSEALSIVGISHLAERLVSTLSDGERQKAMIAKALAQRTPVIFLDEPTAFLDYPSKVEIMQLLAALARESGKTIFMSTHDLELALQITDMAWLIDRKLGITTGSPEDLILSGHLQKYFNGEGIEFNSKTGLFQIRRKPTGSFTISGEGIALNMLIIALTRRGFITKVVKDNADIIITSDGKFDYQGEIIQDIYSLLHRII